MKENLFADPDVFLCHQGGDCTEICPRGAKPAEVLGAIRSYIYTFYGWPVWLAKLATNPKNLPIFIGISLIDNHPGSLVPVRGNVYSPC